MPLQRYLEARFGCTIEGVTIVSDNARSPCHPLSQPCDSLLRRHQNQAMPIRRCRSSSRRASHPPSSSHRRFTTTCKPTVSRWEAAATSQKKDLQLLTPARRRNTLSTCTVQEAAETTTSSRERSMSPPEHDWALKVPARRQSPPNLVSQLAQLAPCCSTEQEYDASYDHQHNHRGLNDSLTLLRLSPLRTETRDVRPRMPTKTASGSASSHSSQMRRFILSNIDRAMMSSSKTQ